MHDESRRFVEHGEMLVLVDKGKLGVGGCVRARRRLIGRKFDGDFGAAFEHRGGAQRFATGGDALVGDETSGLGAGEGELVGEKSIEAYRTCDDAERDVQGSAPRSNGRKKGPRPSLEPHLLSRRRYGTPPSISSPPAGPLPHPRRAAAIRQEIAGPT